MCKDLINRLLQPVWKLQYFKFITTDSKMFTASIRFRSWSNEEREIMFLYECSENIRILFSIATSFIESMDSDDELEKFLNKRIKEILKSHE